LKTIAHSRNRHEVRSPQRHALVVDQVMVEESGFGREGGVHGLLPYLLLN
jgi:hypothetical protein